MLPKIDTFECLRCGQCCISVGRTFWRAEQTEAVDDGLPCEMLKVANGIATCKIESVWGRAAKPEMCRDYPIDECIHQRLMRPMREKDASDLMPRR